MICLLPHVGPNKKKISVFRVTRPYLNLLVNLEFFSGFLLCILKGEIQNAYLKKELKKCVCI